MTPTIRRGWWALTITMLLLAVTIGQPQFASAASAQVPASGIVAGLASGCDQVSPRGGFGPVAPSRLLDTRNGTGAPPAAIGPGGTVTFTVTGRGGVPTTGVSAVALNITVGAPTAAGFITAYASGAPVPLASNLNFTAGQTVPNLVIAPVGADGKVALYNGGSATVQLIADIAGYYLGATPTVAGGFSPVAPSRLLDTRNGTGAPPAAIGPGGTVTFTVTGRGGVPTTGVSAVALNITVSAPTAAGFITAYASGAPVPLASNLNFTAGQTVPNLVIAPVGADGKVALYNGGPATVQLIADIAGYYLGATPTVAGGFSPVAPSRLLDTRNGTGAPPAAIGPGGTVTFTVTGRGGVPTTGVSAVALNITVSAPTAAGFITAYASGAPVPLASNLNFTAGQTVPNLVIAPVGADGKVALYNGGPATVQLIADIAGHYRASGAAVSAAIIGLSSGATTSTSTTLRWSNLDDDARVDVVIRRVLGTTPPTSPALNTAVGVLPAAGATVRDDGLAAATKYAYSVFARDACGNASTAASILVTTASTPIGGTVAAWGDGSNGQLGNGDTESSSTPQPITGLTSVTAIATGAWTSYAVRADGSAWAWGSGGYGQLGNADTADSSVPVKIKGLTNVIAIAGGHQTGYALRNDGTVWAWGSGYLGQLGDGASADSPVPVQVSGLSGVTAISAGSYTGYALLANGAVRSWGYGLFGQLGSGSATFMASTPIAVSALTDVIGISGGSYTGYALHRDGTVSAWGRGTDGQLGNGATGNSSAPGPVSGLDSATAVSSADNTGYALLSDGTVRAWGYGPQGQLGDGTTRISNPLPRPVYGLTGVAAIAGGGNSGYALRSDGSVQAWGEGSAGQLGNGRTVASAVPVRVSDLSTATAIAAGTDSAFALVR